ncbi:MAG: tRNA (adenosine(37)-N6)-threonylcarbamoyltransferase complex dimerization subunit type 1 TsaB [Candidatus Eisenbacteria bacterium]
MRVVAIETATTFGSVALVEENVVLAETCLFVPQGHCESVLPAVEELLLAAGKRVSEVDAFAVSLGPGSFTALRIGLSTAKALAFSCGKPLAGVGTLDAVAFNVAGLFRYVCPIVDARRREVFYSVYSDNEGVQEKMLEYSSDSPHGAVDTIAALLEDRREEEAASGGGETSRANVAFLGDGVKLCRELVVKRLGARASFAADHVGIPRASAVGLLALRSLRGGGVARLAGEGARLAGMEPIYVRRSDAELRRKQA